MRYWKPEDFGWMEIDSVSADGAPAKVAMDETIARVDLPRPLAPGDSVSLRLHFVVQIPKQFDRLGHRGEEYSISQWYPKVAVYDLKGWHPDPFHYAAEFYGDFGTFDVAITLPDRYWVGSTGVLEDAEGGDNEIPLADAETSRDSVTVTLGVTCADSLRERWPRLSLRLESDLRPAGAREPFSVTIPWDQRPTIRVPRGAPVHYSYRWDDGEGQVRREADADGRSGPVRFFVANRDTALSDTLRSLAAEGSEPSVKTLRYHADRVHDFAWVASPNYVRSDTTWSGIAVRALAWRNDQAGWRDLKRFTVDALRHHTDLVGPYVWPQFTSAEGWCGGSAMEYPMLIEIEPEFASSATHLLDDTVAHESGHNWFYGMIANDERADPWLDEGFAQYLEDHYVDAKYPKGMARLSSRFPSIGKTYGVGRGRALLPDRRVGARRAADLDLAPRRSPDFSPTTSRHTASRPPCCGRFKVWSATRSSTRFSASTTGGISTGIHCRCPPSWPPKTRWAMTSTRSSIPGSKPSSARASAWGRFERSEPRADTAHP